MTDENLNMVRAFIELGPRERAVTTICGLPVMWACCFDTMERKLCCELCGDVLFKVDDRVALLSSRSRYDESAILDAVESHIQACTCRPPATRAMTGTHVVGSFACAYCDSISEGLRCPSCGAPRR